MMLVPNTVLRPATEIKKALSLLPAGQRGALAAQLALRGTDSALVGLKGLTVRVDSIQVLDNHDYNLFGTNEAADVYPLVGVVTSAASAPFNAMTLGVFNGIKDGNYLSMTPQWDPFRELGSVPSFLDLHVTVMKSNQGTRNVGAELQKAMGDSTVQAAMKALTAAITAVNPIAGLIATAGAAVFQLIAGLLANDKDEQIYYAVGSFEDDPDDLGIGRKWQFSDEKNACVNYEILGRY